MDSNEILITSLLFKKALNNLLKNNEGMVVSVEDKMKPMFPGVEKVLVFKKDDEIHIMEYEGDLENGEFIDIEFE